MTLHGVQAVDQSAAHPRGPAGLGAARLAAPQRPPASVQVDQALDRIHGGHDHAHFGADAQAAAAAHAAPGMAVVLHHVLIVAQVVQVQQAVDGDIQDLHEAAELHHGGDQAAEGLADALSQIRALEEVRDVAVRLVGALLQARQLSPSTDSASLLVLDTAARRRRRPAP